MNIRILALTAAAAVAMMGVAGNAQAAFTGAYAADHWATTVTNAGNGTAIVSADGATATLTSSNFDPFTDLIASDVALSLTLQHDVTVSFDWAYASNDENGSTADPFGYSINGVFTQLSQDDSWDSQSGHVGSLVLHSGDVLSFVARSTDSIFGASTTTVSGFTATPAVPEPESAVLALVGLGVVAACALRRQAR